MRSTSATDLLRTGALLVLLLLSSPWRADAQPDVERRASPVVEVSPVVSGFPGTRVLGLGLRLTGGNGGRLSLEGGLDWTDAMNTEFYADQITWFYSWQVKQTLWEDGTSSRVFATYGTAGWAERQSVPPGRLKSSIVPPILPLVGVGWQRNVAKYIGLRGDVQFLIGPFEGANAVPRVGAGLTLPVRF